MARSWRGICDHCGVEWEADKLEPVTDGCGGIDLVCPECLDEYYVRCDMCGSYCDTDFLIPTTEYRHVCPECVDKGYYVMCEDCHRAISAERAQTLHTVEGDRAICLECLDYRDRHGQSNMCEGCGEWFEEPLLQRGQDRYGEMVPVCMHCASNPEIEIEIAGGNAK